MPSAADRLPPLLSERPRGQQALLVLGVSGAFGLICGAVLGLSAVLYLVLSVPVAILGGFLAGLEHARPGEAALRGLIGGAMFGIFILIGHAIFGGEETVALPEPAVLLALITALGGSGLGALGTLLRARLAASAQPAVTPPAR